MVLTVAGALTGSICGVLSSAAAPAGAQSPGPSSGTIALSRTAGPIGTVVTVSGQLAPECRTAGTLGVKLTFQAATRTGGADQLTLAPKPTGTFTFEYQVPPDLTGYATRGLFAHPVVPGTYQFSFYGSVNCGPSAAAAFEVTGPATPAPTSFVGMASTPDGKGYWLASASGGVFAYGDAPYLGSLPGIGVAPGQPVVGITPTPDGRGYWLVTAGGGVFAFGDAGYYGSLPGDGVTPAAPIVAITATPDGRGYWLLGADGGVFAFGDAPFDGRPTTGNSPFESIARRPTGGYAVAMSHPGQVYLFPGGTKLTDVPLLGNFPLATSLSGSALPPGGAGAWQVGLDGGVFAFGDAGYYGSLPGDGVTPAAPIVAITATPDGRGYWLLGADGGVFAFGDAGFFGSSA